MKIVDKGRFIKSIGIIGSLIFLIIFLLINITFSHTEIQYKTFYVSAGDTLWNIAKQEKNSNEYFENKDIRFVVDEIKYINHLDNSNLEIGQQLNIPIG